MWTSNRLCEAAILQRKADIHRERLRNIKPSIDTKDPRRPKSSNSKGARLEEERNAQIMHENTILLDKLSKILTREKTAQVGGERLPAVAAPPAAGSGLHDIYRRQVREKIDRENQQLLKRLQYMKPSIDMLQFEQQWQEHAHFAMMGRSQATNPMLAPSPAKKSRGQGRPQTVPAGGARGPAGPPGGARPVSSQQSKRPPQTTPAHYLQPLHAGGKAPTAAGGRPTSAEIRAEVSWREADAVLEAALEHVGSG